MDRKEKRTNMIQPTEGAAKEKEEGVGNYSKPQGNHGVDERVSSLYALEITESRRSSSAMRRRRRWSRATASSPRRSRWIQRAAPFLR